MNFLAVLRNKYRRLHNSLIKSRYTPYNMAEYLRSVGAQVGEGCFIASYDLDVGIEPYLLKIGNHVAIAAGVICMTHDGATWIFRDQLPDLQAYGTIVIEDNCFIGLRSLLCPNIRIGRNSIVGAGSVVLSDVPPNSVVMGVPARPFGSIEKYREKCIGRWAAQTPPGAVLEPGETWWNSRHHLDNREKLRKHLLQIYENELAGPCPSPECGDRA